MPSVWPAPSLPDRTYGQCQPGGAAPDAGAAQYRHGAGAVQRLCSTRRLVSNYTAIPDWLLNPELDAETFVDAVLAPGLTDVVDDGLDLEAAVATFFG